MKTMSKPPSMIRGEKDKPKQLQPKRQKPIPKKRKTPRRVRPEIFHGHKRVVLHGKAREARRAEIFARAGGRCEERILERAGLFWVPTFRCTNRATEWSHKRHGSNKCDCMACGIASCHDCHVRRHNAGGKPIRITKKEAIREEWAKA